MRFTVARVYRSKAFRITLLLFAGLNLWSWVRHRNSPACCDQYVSFGFPFPVQISGGIEGSSDYYLLGLLLDVAIAITIALLVTWIVESIRN